MPTYKNISDEDVAGIVGVGLIKAGEFKTVPDPVEHPSLQLMDDQEAADLLAKEPENAAAVTEAQHISEATEVTPPAPAAPQPPEQPAQPAAPSPQPDGSVPAVDTLPQPDNVNHQGA